MRIFRQAEARDREGILAISTSTWEGWDYVPLFIDRWLAEDGFFVVEDDSRIIGITKNSEISPGELWLEAIRVDPQLRGQGLGHWIAEKQLEKALEQNPKSIRLSTADKNTASLAIIKKLGFREYVVYKFFRFEEKPSFDESLDYSAVRQLDAADSDSIEKTWKHITSSQEYGVTKGLFPQTWKFSEWTRELFESHVKQGIVHSIPDTQAILILVPNRYSPEGLEIAFLEGDDESVKLLGNFALRQISRIDNESYRSTGFAAGSRKKKHFVDLGIKIREDLKEVYVFDYPL